MKLKKNSKENDQKMKSENDLDMDFQKYLEENDPNTEIGEDIFSD